MDLYRLSGTQANEFAPLHLDHVFENCEYLFIFFKGVGVDLVFSPDSKPPIQSSRLVPSTGTYAYSQYITLTLFLFVYRRYFLD